MNRLDEHKIDISNCVSEEWRNAWKDKLHAEVQSYASETCICLHVVLSTDQLERDKLRDQVLDFGDWSVSRGFRRPLACVLEMKDCDDTNDWRADSGDQEWLRGQFSLQVAADKQDAQQRLLCLLENDPPAVDELRPKSDTALASALMSILKDPPRKQTEQQAELLRMTANSLRESARTVQLLSEWNDSLLADHSSISKGGEE